MADADEKKDGLTTCPVCGEVYNKDFTARWKQKLAAQLISMKWWTLVLITVLIVFGFLTGGEFLIGFGIVMGVKSANDFMLNKTDKQFTDPLAK